MINVKVNIEGLDSEWMQLILEAKSLGIEKDEIREFLNSRGVGELVAENS
ncbi:anti-repressor SinI family protein [Cytobacillus sp. FJAT-54145]|uniref:Anti-repressor SinI family protein n=1 Tax=Cytobacillus spartinae TaxID=3299023 RepID=A0ABW6KB45_9BACI